MMKFLIISKTKDTFYTLNSEERERVHEEQKAFWEKYMMEGKLKDVYHLIGKHGSAAIWEVGSLEEVEHIFRDMPNYHYSYFKIYPVTEWKKI